MNDHFEAVTSDSLHELVAPREHLNIAWRFFGLLIAASVYLAIAFTLFDAAIISEAKNLFTIPTLLIVCIAIGSIGIILRAYGDARHAVKSRTKQIELNHQHARYLELVSSNASQTDLTNHALLVNGTTLGAIDLANKFPTKRDLDYFIDQVDFANSKGLRLRDWLGRTMPSRKVIATIADWHQMLEPFVGIGAISEPTEARRTKVLIDDAARVRYLLNQVLAEADQKQKQTA